MAAGDVTQGERRDDETEPHEYKPGDYGRWRNMWFCRCPGPDEPFDSVVPRTGNLSAHQVAEHDDGTITVQPSILVHQVGTDDGWHGYLERGVWREV